MRYAIILIQSGLALFYAYFTILMWGPFIAGVWAAKLFVALIVFIPAISIVIMHFKPRGLTIYLVILTFIQLAAVLGLTRA